MSPAIHKIIRLLREVQGLDAGIYEESFLDSSVKRRCEMLGLPAERYAERLAHDGIERATFLASLNVGYSEFFRDPLAFALVEQVILPRLADAKAGRTQIRIWSAGCAAGQEPYSIAVLLAELEALRGSAVPHRIFATDRAEEALTIARAGVYGNATLRKVRLQQLHDYFSPHVNGYAVLPRLRECMDFSHHDLLNPVRLSPAASIYGDFDIVFCSNMLFYYRSDIQRVMLDRLYEALTPDGYLVTGEAERRTVDGTEGFNALAMPVSVFQKTARQRYANTISKVTP